MTETTNLPTTAGALQAKVSTSAAVLLETLKRAFSAVSTSLHQLQTWVSASLQAAEIDLVGANLSIRACSCSEGLRIQAEVEEEVDQEAGLVDLAEEAGDLILAIQEVSSGKEKADSLDIETSSRGLWRQKD